MRIGIWEQLIIIIDLQSERISMKRKKNESFIVLFFHNYLSARWCGEYCCCSCSPLCISLSLLLVGLLIAAIAVVLTVLLVRTTTTTMSKHNTFSLFLYILTSTIIASTLVISKVKSSE